MDSQSALTSAILVSILENHGFTSQALHNIIFLESSFLMWLGYDLQCAEDAEVTMVANLSTTDKIVPTK